MQLLDRLKEENEQCWLYNRRLPRMGKALVSPLNPEFKRWKNAEWAPAYDAPDPVWNGFK